MVRRQGTVARAQGGRAARRQLFSMHLHGQAQRRRGAIDAFGLRGIETYALVEDIDGVGQAQARGPSGRTCAHTKSM